MISRQELQKYAQEIGLNLGQAEKNYLQILTLHAISRMAPDMLVFKGGTALMMCHSLNRFSEDLDFTLVDKDALGKLLLNLKSFLSVEIREERRTKISVSYILRYHGPLYDGTMQTTSKVEIDISFREQVIVKTEPTRILHPYKDTPSFFIQVMDLEEIFAEKIRAIMTRQKARDVFDLEFLIAKKIQPNLTLINQKLSYYHKSFSRQKLETSIEHKRKIWVPELSNLVKIIPDFEDVKKKILKLF